MELRLGRLRDAERTLWPGPRAGRGQRAVRGDRDAGHRRHAGRPEPGRVVPQRPRRGGRPPPPLRRARRGRQPGAEPVPLAGPDGAPPRRRGRPRRPRSSCSTRPSGCTSATTPPTCSPSTRSRARRARGARRRRRGAGVGARAPGRGRRRAELPTRVRAHHPGPRAARRARGHRVRGEPARGRSALLDRLAGRGRGRRRASAR